MKRFSAILCLATLGVAAAMAQPKSVTLFDHVVYYDGYNGNIFDKDLQDGVFRMKNSLYSVRLDNEKLADIGDDLVMDVVLGALCDNYDRIANIDLVFAPKGADSYEYDKVERIEVARFITPFMNKNKQPTEVPYTYDIPNVAKIIRDKDINDKYDLWLELEIFGVPYAANNEVAGCKDRNDVFEGTLSFVYTPAPAKQEKGNVVVPIYVKTPDEAGNVNMNNYTAEATDTLGRTTRTFEFEVPQDVADARIYLIMTNHGANSGGEEYKRRQHLVYYDGDIVLSYKPGGISCEPYRQYNTQSNGIYQYGKMPDSYWATNSNWCPGQAVPIREIALGAVSAGKHSVMIRVPDAVFTGKQGDFRPSLYFHGVTEGTVPASVEALWMEGPEISVTRQGCILSFTSDEPVDTIMIHSFDGRLLDIVANPQGSIDMSAYGGPCILTFVTADGRTTVKSL